MSAIRLLWRPASNHDVVPVDNGLPDVDVGGVESHCFQARYRLRRRSSSPFQRLPGSNPAKLRPHAFRGRARRAPARQRRRQLLPDRGRQPADARRRGRARRSARSWTSTCARAGAAIHDIAAVILTHGHPDHVGMAEGLRVDAPRAVHVHEADAHMARTGKIHKLEGSCCPTCATRRCGGCSRWAPAPAPFRTPKIERGDDVHRRRPRRPRPPAHRSRRPGHSPGHVALPPPRPRRPVRRRRAVHLQPADRRPRPAADAEGVRRRRRRRRSRRSTRSRRIDAGTLLFGHGEPWTDGPASAVAHAREVGVT